MAIEFFGGHNLLPKPSTAVIPWNLEDFNYNKKEVYLGFTQNLMSNFYPTHPEEIETANWSSESHKYNLVENESLSSESLVFYLAVNDFFYSALHEIVPYVLKLHESDPSMHVIIHRPNVFYPEGEKEQRDIIYKEILEFFVHEGVNFSYLGPEDPPTAYRVKNFANISKNLEPFENNKMYLTHQDVKNTLNKLKSFYGIKSDKTPQKKVYLSRAHKAEERLKRQLPVVLGGQNQFTDDIRMENEAVLEDFFKNRGYDILVPEHRFSTLKEQIEYFDGVSVLAGVTGSGLVNCLLMQDGQLVVEIVAELVFDSGHDGASFQILNSEFYLHDSYIKEHVYLAVPSRRDPYKVIKSLENLEKKLSSSANLINKGVS